MTIFRIMKVSIILSILNICKKLLTAYFTEMLVQIEVSHHPTRSSPHLQVLNKYGLYDSSDQ